MSYYAYDGASHPGPGSFLDATTQLDGPGTSAYLQQGPYTSYAYEGQNDSIFEKNTTSFADPSQYEVSFNYQYSSNYYMYEHQSAGYYFSPPIYYDPYEFSIYYGYPGKSGFYSVVDTETSIYGDHEHVASQSVYETTLGNGYYYGTYHSQSADYIDGQQVPGSASSYSSTFYGYTTN